MAGPTAELPHRPFSRLEFARLVELGLFGDERVELLHGAIVRMSPMGSRHIWAVSRLTRLFVLAVGDRADVMVQSSFAATDDSQPEPDVALVPVLLAPAVPSVASLVIEVADATLHTDLRVKVPLYARAGIPEVWVVDVAHRVVLVFRKPRAGEEPRYDEATTVDAAGSVSPVAFPDIVLPTASFLPPE